MRHAHRLPSWRGGIRYHDHIEDAGAVAHFHPYSNPDGPAYRLDPIPSRFGEVRFFVVRPGDWIIGEIRRITRSTDTKIAGTRLRRPGKGATAWRYQLGTGERVIGEKDTRREAVEALIAHYEEKGKS